jgi:rfaE bifunctional protein kinase chain/domain
LAGYADGGDGIRGIRTRAGQTGRIAFVSGNFNVIHPGHLRLMKFAKEVGDFLVVGINPDSATGVTVPVALRLEGARSIAMIDEVVPLSAPPEDFISRLKPEFVIKGKEFEDQRNPEAAVVEGYGGKLIFSSGEMRFSSIAMLQREYNDTNFSTIRKALDYPLRHDFELGALKRILPDVSGVRVLVIGDLIVDEYITCDPLGMSQEDPTIVVTPIDSKTFVGGAGVVAAHAKGLGAEVHYCTVTGHDQAADFTRDWLGEHGVHFHPLEDDTRPTTRKQRFRAQNKTLLRVNHLRQTPISHALAEKMLARVESLLPTTDLLLFSDFNYGCLPQFLVDVIVEKARTYKVMMAADSQASSQMADISRFKGMALITPTEREARLALRDFESGLAVISHRLREVAEAGTVVVTLGAEGTLIVGEKDGQVISDRLPAFNTSPIDVAGAGDSLFTSMALAMCIGADVWRSVYFGSLAAACQVSRLGNRPLTVQDLLVEIDAPSA